MSSAIMEAQLLRLLSTDPELARRRCHAERGPGGGVRVFAGASLVGTWYWTRAHFEFVPASGPPQGVRLQTAAQALIHTRRRLTKRL
jgi:hypothetical protein